ncbi:hypothetical protein [Streptomyces sp. HUAS TT20]|uniref:hypothetical protein n=1 Tax=Streptomyces sp. HUAS TT20 TaxID=3447509 RepID=UPI0021DA014C|nr:hypothetical protein [Streptomyces sp. HUAS 15-9]UXY32926.1 hypothetical protein N8I87_32610 [Streptomyces sp. HUAS 15-9]
MNVALKDSASALSALEPIALMDWRTPAWRQASAKARLVFVSNGDLDPYWRFHAAREHERLYPTPDQRRLDLAA